MLHALDLIFLAKKIIGPKPIITDKPFNKELVFDVCEHEYLDISRVIMLLGSQLCYQSLNQIKTNTTNLECQDGHIGVLFGLPIYSDINEPNPRRLLPENQMILCQYDKLYRVAEKAAWVMLNLKD